MDKVKYCTVKSRWMHYDPSDPAQVPDEDGDYFALVKEPFTKDVISSYKIYIMHFCTTVTDLVPDAILRPVSLQREYLEFLKEKYKYGAFTEPGSDTLPNYTQDHIIAFRIRTLDLVTEDLVNVFTAVDEFDVALKEAEDRLNQ